MDDIVASTLAAAKEMMDDFDSVIDLFEMKFIWLNEKGAGASGYTPNDMIGHNISEFMELEGINTADIISKTLMGGEFEIPVKTKNGSLTPVNMNHLSIKHNGNWFLLSKILD